MVEFIAFPRGHARPLELLFASQLAVGSSKVASKGLPARGLPALNPHRLIAVFDGRRLPYGVYCKNIDNDDAPYITGFFVKRLVV